MMSKTGFMAVVIMSVVATLMVQSAAGQTVHVVGDSFGWVEQLGNADGYDIWADTKTFRVGDILTFNFTTGAHDIVEVTEASRDACTSTNAIGSIIKTGPANVTLTRVGKHWYICTFDAGAHCRNGQKLDITVIAAAPGTTASPPPPFSTNGPTTSPTTPGPTTSPPPPSTHGPTTSPTTPGSTTSSPPPPGSSSSVVLGSMFVTFFSVVISMCFM